MVRPGGEELMDIEKTGGSAQFPRGRGMRTMQVSTWGGQEAKGSRQTAGDTGSNEVFIGRDG